MRYKGVVIKTAETSTGIFSAFSVEPSFSVYAPSEDEAIDYAKAVVDNWQGHPYETF